MSEARKPCQPAVWGLASGGDGFRDTSMAGFLLATDTGSILDTVNPEDRSALRADRGETPSIVPWTDVPCLFFAWYWNRMFDHRPGFTRRSMRHRSLRQSWFGQLPLGISPRP